MTKDRKIEILYRKAKGQPIHASDKELLELQRYKVTAGYDADIATRKNIANYVSAVDNGCRISFYDWCANNLQGDRRRKSGRAEEIASANKTQSAATVFVGWLIWGMALYWMFDESVSVGACAILGAIVSFVLQRVSRRLAGFTVIILPIIIAVLCAQ